jgi:hypothetical protein
MTLRREHAELQCEVLDLERRIAETTSRIARMRGRTPRLRELGWGLGLGILTLLGGFVVMAVWVLIVVSHI